MEWSPGGDKRVIGINNRLVSRYGDGVVLTEVLDVHEKSDVRDRGILDVASNIL